MSQDTGAESGSAISLGSNHPSATTSSSESSHESTTSSGSASKVLVLAMSGTTKDSAGGGAGYKEYFCGIGKCRPKWMQVVFRNSIFFTFILCLNCTVEGALVSGFTSVVLSTLERRYRFSSVWAGSIASAFDASVLISVLFISYFGGRGHKPRWLGISLIVQGIGSLVFSLPQFVFGEYNVGTGINQTLELCDPTDNSTSICDSDANNFALAFFFIGNILIGVGAAPLFTVGTSYIDEIVHPKYVSIHLGIFYAFSIIGPAIGYGLGGVFLSMYVDPWVETSLEPSDPGWVGAWWMGFIFSGVLSLLCAIPFLLFPKLLPNSSFVKQERAKEMAQKYKGQDSVDEVDVATKLKTFPQHLKLVLKTPSWVFITTAICCSLVIVSGVASFAPKYLESQFRITASLASLLAGLVGILGGGVGVFLGSLIVYFTKSKGRNVALINWVVTLVALAPTFVFFVSCPTLELVGVNVKYSDGSLVSTSTSSLNSSCFSHCNCDSADFEPVCGEDNLTYFSPCTAGCLDHTVNNTTGSTFENCACIADRLKNAGDNFDNVSTFNGVAVDGQCSQDCNKLEIFLTVVFLDLLLIFILQVPNVIITIRCVAEEQRTLALGAQSVAFRALGSIPGPLLFGAIFDSTCIYWQYECSRRGNCWVYNNTHLSQRALTLALLGIATNFIFSVLCWLFYPKQDVDYTVADTSNTNKTELQPSERNVTEEDRSNQRVAGRLDSNCSEDALLESNM